MDAQIRELRRGIEVIVATPGRLLDHVQQKTIMLGQVEFLVLDEADRMLDMGFIPDIRRIINLLPARRQSLLFSATFSEEIRKLADTMLHQPQLIEVARRNTVSETIRHLVYPVPSAAKRDLLTHLLGQADEHAQILVFVGTKFGCSRLTRHLQKEGISADAIHGDKNQQQRTEALENFKSGATRVLVATDVAARGLDVDDLPYVVNFELPTTPEDYIHRIGRTGRAGKSGTAVSLVAPEETPRLSAIERLIKLKIPQETVPGFAPDATDSDHSPRRPARHTAERPSPRGSRSHAPHASRQGHVAEDGFDFDQPYTPATPAAGQTVKKSEETASALPARRSQKAVAFLLGGSGRLR